uniref:At1g61320/AtMIF1 LRR domain-containing protein n=1 Tax=Oryza punctata TaxID=4537 RepID=A0A0E0L509_ORYPU
MLHVPHASQIFLRSWRCHPNLIFSAKTLGLNDNLSERNKLIGELNGKVDHIMKNYSGVGLRTFGLKSYYLLDTCYLDRWLQIAVTPAIEELILIMFPEDKAYYYDFPFSHLFNRGGSSINYLHLSYCVFRPTYGLNCLRSLFLYKVHITGHELGCLFSNSFALEQLELADCKELNYLKIPCLLQRLSKLTVFGWEALQVIEIKAPNHLTFHYEGNNLARLSDGGLPFLHLKHLTVFLYTFPGAVSPAYDYLSLAYFLDASPATLKVSQTRMEHDVISEDSSHLRQMPGHHHHDTIKNVKIIGFCSAKSMVELTCHILENATSLECLTLDTIYDGNNNPDRLSLVVAAAYEAENALPGYQEIHCRESPLYGEAGCYEALQLVPYKFRCRLIRIIQYLGVACFLSY